MRRWQRRDRASGPAEEGRVAVSIVRALIIFGLGFALGLGVEDVF